VNTKDWMILGGVMGTAYPILYAAWICETTNVGEYKQPGKNHKRPSKCRIPLYPMLEYRKKKKTAPRLIE
jgi:hypothetical protein